MCLLVYAYTSVRLSAHNIAYVYTKIILENYKQAGVEYTYNNDY